MDENTNTNFEIIEITKKIAPYINVSDQKTRLCKYLTNWAFINLCMMYSISLHMHNTLPSIVLLLISTFDVQDCYRINLHFEQKRIMIMVVE